MTNQEVSLSVGHRCACCVVAGVCFLFLAFSTAPVHAGRRAGEATWSVKPRSMATQIAPKAIAYVEKTDYVVRQGSVFAVTPYSEHDWVSYHGNRLTQFRYLGPPGTGGIYDAMELERTDRQLDPGNYRYHWGRSR